MITVRDFINENDPNYLNARVETLTEVLQEKEKEIENLQSEINWYKTQDAKMKTKILIIQEELNKLNHENS